MRSIQVLLGVFLLVVLFALLGRATPTTGDRDCANFATQAAAQSALAARPSDPERLDADNDGVACDSYFGGPAALGEPDGTGQVRSVPSGGVATGDGSTT